ncbi:MAG: hypothetical protein HC819_12015 [Cyclobacteriaceae bacterium]|nr:hypothetical protein [Cyclobacteriaceae bacterium]
MINDLKNFFRENGLISAIYIILFVIITNAVFTLYYRTLLLENAATKQQVIEANRSVESMNSFVIMADLGLRGYLIEQDDKLLAPFNGAIGNYQKNFETMEALLEKQGFEVDKLTPAFNAIDRYMKLVEQMVKMAQSGDVSGAIDILRTDPGSEAYKQYSPVSSEIFKFENELLKIAEENYNGMIIRMMVSQILLI